MAQEKDIVCRSCQSKGIAIRIKSVGQLCHCCFIGVVERRIKKNVRLNHRFKKDEKVLVIDDSSTKSRVMIYLLDHCLGGLPVYIKIRKADVSSVALPDLDGFNKVLLPLSADDQAEAFISWLFGKDNKVESPKSVPFLSCLLDEEIEAYARAKTSLYQRVLYPLSTKTSFISSRNTLDCSMDC